MKKIELSQGQYAIVDDEDYDVLNQWKWCADYCKSGKKFYAKRTCYLNGKKRIRMHRFVTNTTDRNIEVDHINGNSLDNRKSNLRPCSKSRNQQNRNKTINNKSGYKGVAWHKISKKWIVRIGVNSIKIHIGRYDCVKEAARAYNSAAIIYHGEFAYLNEVSNDNA